MNTKKEVYLGIDTSYQQGIVLLCSSEEVLFAADLPNKMAHGQKITLSIASAMIFCEQHEFTIIGTFSGVGPGSFIGTRLALATLLGFSFAKMLPLGGFCSHHALASSIETPPREFYITMKASGNLFYSTKFQSTEDGLQKLGPTAVIPIEDFIQQIATSSVTYTDEAEILKRYDAPIEVKSILGPNALGVFKAIKNKINNDSLIDESGFIRPNYVKSPNISSPKKCLKLI